MSDDADSSDENPAVLYQIFLFDLFILFLYTLSFMYCFNKAKRLKDSTDESAELSFCTRVTRPWKLLVKVVRMDFDQIGQESGLDGAYCVHLGSLYTLKVQIPHIRWAARGTYRVCPTSALSPTKASPLCLPTLCGSGATYLRFQMVLMYAVFLMMFVCVGVLVPLNWYGSEENDRSLAPSLAPA